MSDKPKNVVLLLNGDKMRASVERGVETPKRVQPAADYAVSGYEIKAALTGEIMIVISFDGTDTKDYLAFKTKAEALGFLAQALR